MATATGLPEAPTRLASAVATTLTALLELVGFWTAVLVTLAALAVLALRPDGWLTLAAGLFTLDGLALVAGHGHRREG